METHFYPGSTTTMMMMQPPSRLLIVSGIILIAATVALGIGLWIGAETDRFGRVSEFEVATAFPTISAMPSAFPTTSPAPTLRPSSSPSDVPSVSPTMFPSNAPSVSPTNSPTMAPTVSPAPTTSPSDSPTSSPTAPPIPNKYTFRMKLYWRKGYYWQEETIEREWCLECTKCNPLTVSGNGEGCVRKSGCDRGDQFWLQKCRKNGNNAKFTIMNRDTKRGDLFQIANTNLCVERKSARYIALERCNRNEPRQRWLNFRARETPFAWTPLEGSAPPRCATQHHHPKAKEVVYVEDCSLAHRYTTGFWEAYPA